MHSLAGNKRSEADLVDRYVPEKQTSWSSSIQNAAANRRSQVKRRIRTSQNFETHLAKNQFALDRSRTERSFIFSPFLFRDIRKE